MCDDIFDDRFDDGDNNDNDFEDECREDDDLIGDDDDFGQAVNFAVGNQDDFPNHIEWQKFIADVGFGYEMGQDEKLR